MRFIVGEGHLLEIQDTEENPVVFRTYYTEKLYVSIQDKGFEVVYKGRIIIFEDGKIIERGSIVDKKF